VSKVAGKLKMTRYLNPNDVKTLFNIVKKEIALKGAAFYGWVNAPVIENGVFTHTTGWGENTQTREVSGQEALDIYKSKLDGAYGERFALTMALIPGLIRQGKKIALLQIKKEEGIPFDAAGWLVLSIEGYPLFHLAPWDLPMAEVEEAGIITLVVEGSEEADIHGWKGTDKVVELSNILDWML
jgi:hypothetical protein